MIRVLDVVFSGLALLLLLPLFLVVMVVLRLTGEGEVFYRQERAGQQGRSFDLLKFVTMVKDSPNIGTGVLTNTLHSVRHHQYATDEDYILSVVERRAAGASTRGTIGERGTIER